MCRFEINEARLMALESLALSGDKESVSGSLNPLSHTDQLAYLGAMKQDFDRLHDLDPNFPELVIYGHDSLPSTGPVGARIFKHRLAEVVPTEIKLQIDSIETRRQVSGFEQLFNPRYWQNPFEVHSLYDPRIPPRSELQPVR